ncbi:MULTISPECIES: NAD-dependent epimerase/dehydratase family protein [unclassified Bradyrhizobium]|uniref:NAD-dependent epimerase/dehydratase family protein n=1 Tax=unclassified Bradyrhizobium TaxID=2631580 RepID=UPI0028EEAAC1|nr:MULTISPECIES: NAD-dependent epimerase/dehydratase family protein [unclassified Bradyrhizobium]
MERHIEQQQRSLVIGGSGLVGNYLLDQLIARGERPLTLMRSAPARSDVGYLPYDLERPAQAEPPPFDTLYCTARATLLAPALPHFIRPGLQRLVVLSSTSIFTKADSEEQSERDGWRSLMEAERQIAATCTQSGIGWTILRPTLIYSEGRDKNITPLSRLIRRFGVMPLVGGGRGLRQPVHAEDLASGMIAAAAAPAATDKIYAVPGGETLTYREMIGRIFDGLGVPRRTPSVPAPLWRTMFPLLKPLFPGANVAMGLRMMQDMAFDATPAIRDFGWSARDFRPLFD